MRPWRNVKAKSWKKAEDDVSHALSVKDALVKTYFYQDTYGVKFSEVYTDLEHVDLDLTAAQTLAAKSPLTDFDKSSVKLALAGADDYKRALLSAVTTAAETSFHFLGRPFKDVFWTGVSSPNTSLDPHNVVAIAQGPGSSPAYYVAGLNVLTGAPDTAIGDGKGIFKLTTLPAYTNILGVTDQGKDIDVWGSSSLGTEEFVYNLWGKQVGHDLLSTFRGLRPSFLVQVRQSTGLDEMFLGEQTSSFVTPAVGSVFLPFTGAPTLGPCPFTTFTGLGSSYGLLTDVTPILKKEPRGVSRPITGWDFAGYTLPTAKKPSDVEDFLTKLNCGGAASPIVIGPDGGGNLPVLRYLPGQEKEATFFLWAAPASNNDLTFDLDKLSPLTGRPLSGFGFTSGHFASIDPIGIADLGCSLVVLGTAGYQMAAFFLNPLTGKDDTSIPSVYYPNWSLLGDETFGHASGRLPGALLLLDSFNGGESVGRIGGG